MKMTFFTQKNLLSQAKVVWKTLVILILAVLLFVPTPALALDYNGTIQSYISNAKVELDAVLTAIEKLPNLSYETGKATLSEIESQLQKIQTEAGKNSAELSDHLEKRINLAIQKAGNVKEYGDALKSFSDPDILGEISELNEMVAKLTTNL
jgi:hypothetical protein